MRLGLMLAACTGDVAEEADSAWAPAEWELPAAAEGPTVLAEGLDAPLGIALGTGGVYVAEYGGGRILRVGSGVEEVATGLGGPYAVAVEGDGVWWTERDAGVVASLAGTVATAQDVPGRIGVSEGVAWWLEEGTGALWGDGQAVTTLDRPLGLAVAGGDVWVAEQAGRLSRWSGGVLETVLDTEWPAMDVSADTDGAVLTTRDASWPGGGHLYDDAGTLLSSSPPGALRVRVDGDRVYWSSSQGITRVARGGGVYEVVVAQSAVGDFDVRAGFLCWSDPVRGAVYAYTLD